MNLSEFLVKKKWMNLKKIEIDFSDEKSAINNIE
jgi:hypothetical protein